MLLELLLTAGVLLRTDELLAINELLILDEELARIELLDLELLITELELTATLLREELIAPAAVPATRHSKIPVDCVAFSMDTRKRLVTIPFSARLLNAFFTSGTLPALTQALPLQYSI